MDMPLIVRGSTELDNYYPANLTGSADPSPKLADLLSSDRDGDSAVTFQRVSTKYSEKPMFVSRDPFSLAKYSGKQLGLPEGPSAAVLRVQ